MKTITVTFSAVGYVKQTIELDPAVMNELDLNEAKIESLLNSGNLVTTVQEDGSLVLYNPQEIIVGKIVDVENNLEYEDFVVQGDE